MIMRLITIDVPSFSPASMKNLVKLAVTLAIFFLIFRNIDLREVAETIGNAQLGFVLLGFTAQLLSTLVASYRWNIIMKELRFKQRFLFYLKSYFKGAFFNQALPTSIGGDALRVLDIIRLGFRKRDAFAGVFIDRLVGLSGLLMLNLLANLLRPGLLPDEVFWTINALSLGGIGAILVLMALQRFRLNRFLPARPTTLRMLYALSRRTNRVYRGRKGAIQIAMTLLTHLFSVLAFYCLAQAVGIEYSLIIFLVIVPPVILLTLIPVTFAGWGVREGAMVGLFSLIGADKTAVLSMSILYGVALIITSLPGLYFYLVGKYQI